MSEYKTSPRSTFMTAADCQAQFVEQADKYGTYVDIWEVTIGGQTFLIEMMKRRGVKASWVFGVITNEGQVVWTFPSDPRVKATGFKGNVSTKAFPVSDITWVFFESWDGQVSHVLPLSELLGLAPTTAVTTAKKATQSSPKTSAVKPKPKASDQMKWFVENVLYKTSS